MPAEQEPSEPRTYEVGWFAGESVVTWRNSAGTAFVIAKCGEEKYAEKIAERLNRAVDDQDARFTLRELGRLIGGKIEYDAPGGYVQTTWTPQDWRRIVRLIGPYVPAPPEVANPDLAPASRESEETT